MALEENILTVSKEGVFDEEVITVNADFDTLPINQPVEPVGVDTQKPDSLPVKEHSEEQMANDNRRWLKTQEVKDFPEFLLFESKRMKKPQSCVNNRSETERALGQHRRLNTYISKAVQSDYDGALNTKNIDKLRKQIESNMDQLEHMLFSMNKMKKERKLMSRRSNVQASITKEATLPEVRYYTTAFQRAIAGLIVNGTVSGGKNIDELYNKVKEKYKLDNREELAIFQIITDMGYPTFKDRLRIGEKNQDASKGFGEWQKQYYA